MAAPSTFGNEPLGEFPKRGDPPGRALAVLGISGSLRRDSHNTVLLRAAADALPPGVELDVYGGLRELPQYDADLEDGAVHPAVARLRAAIDDADALLIATPEYNGSIPGVLKNAIDWASRPKGESVLVGKPVAVIGASTGLFGAVWAQAELRKVLGITQSVVVDGEVPVGQADAAFGPDGALADPALAAALAAHVATLVDRCAAIAEPQAA